MNFLYQTAMDGARHARKVFNAYYKRGTPVVGEEIEPKAHIKIELGYMRKWKVDGVQRMEFCTSKQLNMALEAYVAKQLESIAVDVVKRLEADALQMTKDSRAAVAAELAMIDALNTPPEAA